MYNTIMDGNPTTFRHFKGHLYQIICLGKNSETKEEMVVYQNIQTKEIWIRNKEMFFSKIDKEKYPNVKEEYRFEIISK